MISFREATIVGTRDDAAKGTVLFWAQMIALPILSRISGADQ